MRLGSQVEHRRRLVLTEHPRHCGLVRDVLLHERQSAVVDDVGEIEQASRVGELVDDDDAIRGVAKGVSDEIRTNESRAAGDEQRTQFDVPAFA